MHLIRMSMACYMLITFFVMDISAQAYKSKLLEKYDSYDFVEVDDPQSLSIHEAVFIALKNNPEIKTYFMEILALEKRILQYDLMPNPQLEFEIENIFGTGDYNSFKASEITVMVSQEILLAGKISKRARIAKEERDLSYYEYEKKRLEIITAVRKAFNEISVANKLIDKQSELLNNSVDFLKNLKDRNGKGLISPVEVSKAEIAYRKLEIELVNSNQVLRSLIKHLASLLNIDDLSGMDIVEEKLIRTDLPPYNKLYNLLAANPTLSKYRKIERRDSSKLVYEESLAIPNLTVGAGFRRIQEFSINTFIFGLSMPIPIFDSNQGSIEEAKIRLDQNKFNYFAEKIQLDKKLYDYYSKVENYKTVLNAYSEELLPLAFQSLKIIQDGNLAGRYAILDVLDSQRTLIDLEMSYLRTLKEYNNTIIDIEKLIAQNLESIN